MMDPTLIEHIISKVGTPAYLYDERVLKDQAVSMSRVFAGFSPHYSLKANPNPTICRLMADAGFGAEVSSEFEQRVALSAGFSASEVMYDGPAKTVAEIQYALTAGVTHFNFESGVELNRILSQVSYGNRPPTMCVRVNPRNTADAVEKMTGLASRFGVDEENLLNLLRDYPRIHGVHLYVGSQILEAADIVANFSRGLDILGWLCDQKLVNDQQPPILVFGAGIGVPYGTPEQPVDFNAVRTGLLAAGDSFRIRHGELRFRTELGRVLVAAAGTYVTSVVDVKESRGQKFVIVDGGIHHFMRFALTGAQHRAYAVGKVGSPREMVTIGGATCTPYDVLTKCELEEVQDGDLVAIADVGAYGWSMGLSHFLSRATPPEVLVQGNDWRIIRRRGRYEDIRQLCDEAAHTG